MSSSSLSSSSSLKSGASRGRCVTLCTASTESIVCYRTVTLTLLFFMLASAPFASSDMIDQLARQSRVLLNHAVIKGTQVRQCTCDEQRLCIDEMKTQAFTCVDECWGKFEAITSRTQDLRRCFDRTDNLLDELLSCFERNAQSCLETQDEQSLIKKVNITELLRLSAEKIEKTRLQLTKTMAGPIRKIIDTASVFGICVKNCFTAKNDDGFCFDKKECQPLILDNKHAKRGLRQCTRTVDWKKEAGELCDCSVKAGINDLEQYCPMLRLMANRAGSHGSSGSSSLDGNSTMGEIAFGQK